jgi:carboxylesterase
MAIRSMEKEGKTGCLLVHGFGGIPQEMLPLGKFLEGHGFVVSLVQLPGHGREAHNAAKVSWQDWLEALQNAFVELSENVDEVFLLGHSMGGLLALLLSAQHPVRGVVGFAPIIEFNFWQKAAYWASRRFKRLPATLGFYSPDGERLRIQVTRVPPTAVTALKDLVDCAPGKLRTISLPVLLFYGGLDLSVRASSGKKMASLLKIAQLEQVFVPHADHLLMFPRYKKVVWDQTLAFLRYHNSR